MQVFGLAVALCTTFCLKQGDRHLVGKSYDWDQEQALVIANPKGLAKRALVLSAADRPAEWVARHASITFNQYGREFPNGGMNDAGLVVEIMWLDETRVPRADRRRAVSELQWIQLQLDTHASVKEMVAAADEVRVAEGYGKVHYLACDKSGACAAFENLGGRMVVTGPPELQARVLTNDTYAASAAALRQHRGFGGERPIPRDAGSLSRFVRAAALLRSGKSAARAVLDSVRNGTYTKWQIVYDPTALRLSFRSLSHPAWKEIDFGKLASGCPGAARMLDLAQAEAGDVTGRFRDYDTAANRKLLEASLAPLADQLPRGVTGMLAAYPSSLTCAAGAGAERNP